jgi:XTP/dITP diphosphohydrolase
MTRQFEEFINIVKKLRKECPWDRVQTFDSLKASTLEEAFETVEAIDLNDYEELKYELGDLLLHVVLYSIIAEEQNLFNLKDVFESSMDKLVRRHPHVFGNLNITDPEAVKTNWEKIKMSEGRQSALDGVPVNLPSLSKAYRLQEKASKVGFDWKKIEDVWEKVEEEMDEFKETLKDPEKHRTEEELGDFLFALVNYARFLKINPENALRKTNQKFIRRFQYIEQKFKEDGKDIYKSTLEEMDKYWNEIKLTEGDEK